MFYLPTVHMKFVVCIGADYPHIPPTFAINVVEDGGERVEVEEIQIKVCLLMTLPTLLLTNCDVHVDNNLLGWWAQLLLTLCCRVWKLTSIFIFHCWRKAVMSVASICCVDNCSDCRYVYLRDTVH